MLKINKILVYYIIAHVLANVCSGSKVRWVPITFNILKLGTIG